MKILDYVIQSTFTETVHFLLPNSGLDFIFTETVHFSYQVLV